MINETDKIKIKVEAFEGPLSLLLQLIEKHKMDIYDIQIAPLTEDYMQAIAALEDDTDEVVAEFLVMAATLMHIKSRMLIPRLNIQNEEDDPRNELVLRLIEYRRCKLLANDLTKRQEMHGSITLRQRMQPEDLAINIRSQTYPPVVAAMFWQACDRIVQKNSFRFQDINKRVRQLLQHDPLPLKERIRLFWQKLQSGREYLFTDLVPNQATTGERVAGFLAVLELLRMNQILVDQPQAFKTFKVKLNPEASSEELYKFLHLEEEEYV